MYTYRAYFKLTACVKDLADAQNYLKSDDMTKYLKDDTRIPEDVRNAVEQIEWHLKDESSGFVELSANKALSSTELKYISKFASGQVSDGLGPGFEDQDFANYVDEGLEGFENSSWDDEVIKVMFEWPNEYIFEFISNG